MLDDDSWLSDFIQNLTHSPGVYQMLDEDACVLYVGKAKNLKKRVKSYFTKALPAKTQSLVAQIHRIKVIVTESENEALLLESNLIKQLKPKYNVLLKDDKTYPYIFLDTRHDFPRLDIYRGVKQKYGLYFGPYPSAGAARESLNLLQRCFMIRPCRDSFFAHRNRPCLQYQIKRCTAPCVGYISQTDYADAVRHATLFLSGKSQDLIMEMVTNMHAASEQQAYEQAARFRDQIQMLRHIQSQQFISHGARNSDAVACVQSDGLTCVAVMSIRDGRLLGSRCFFPQIALQQDGVLDAFLPQYYLNPQHRADCPPEIWVNQTLNEQHWLENALSEWVGRQVAIKPPGRKAAKQWLRLAEKNAQHAIGARANSKQQWADRLNALRHAFAIPETINRIECFDVSHTMGEKTVAACVVFDEAGAAKQHYRRYNITGITPGDDYAAMYQALYRRYSKLQENNGTWPDVLLIDGGKGQCKQAQKALEEVQAPALLVIGVAKGESRKPGLEKLLLNYGDQTRQLEPESPALHCIQQIRDEAHRFAITGHRRQARKQRQISSLEQINGIGQKKRQALLSYFGGLQGIKNATIHELCQVPGISERLAGIVYHALHEES